LLLKSNLQL